MCNSCVEPIKVLLHRFRGHCYVTNCIQRPTVSAVVSSAPNDDKTVAKITYRDGVRVVHRSKAVPPIIAALENWTTQSSCDCL